MRALNFLIFGLLLTACGVAPDYTSFVSTPTDGWDASAPLVFNVDTLPPGTYDLRLTVRSSAAHYFRYRSLELVLRQEWDSARITSDTLISVPIYTRLGQPKGNGLSLFEQDLDAGVAHLPDSTCGRFIVNHRIRAAEIAGIAAIGIEMRRRD